MNHQQAHARMVTSHTHQIPHTLRSRHPSTAHPSAPATHQTSGLNSSYCRRSHYLSCIDEGKIQVVPGSAKQPLHSEKQQSSHSVRTPVTLCTLKFAGRHGTSPLLTDYPSPPLSYRQVPFLDLTFMCQSGKPTPKPAPTKRSIKTP